MKIETQSVLGLVLCTFIWGGITIADDSAEGVSESSVATLLVRVDEYELETEIAPGASPKQILELIAKGDSGAKVKSISACAATAVCGVPTQARYSRRVPYVRSVNMKQGNSNAKSYQFLVVETRLDVLVTEHSGRYKVDLQYESSGQEIATEKDALPGDSRSQIESSYLMQPGQVQLCGVWQQGRSKVITVRLLE